MNRYMVSTGEHAWEVEAPSVESALSESVEIGGVMFARLVDVEGLGESLVRVGAIQAVEPVVLRSES